MGGSSEVALNEPYVSSPEEITIDAVMEAAELAFAPGHRENLTIKQVCDLCCGLVKFLEIAGQTPERSPEDWKVAIENLRFTLGPQKP